MLSEAMRELPLVISDAAGDFVGANHVRRGTFDLLGRRIGPLEVDPAPALLEAHFDAERDRLPAVGVLEMQQVAADKSRVAAIRQGYPNAVVAADEEFTVDEPSLAPGKIGEGFPLSGHQDVGGRAL